MSMNNVLLVDISTHLSIDESGQSYSVSVCLFQVSSECVDYLMEEE